MLEINIRINISPSYSRRRTGLMLPGKGGGGGAIESLPKFLWTIVMK